jgi:hypothetical protein
VIVCRSQAEIEKLRRVNQLVARILAELRQMVKPGVTTAQIDAVAEQRVREAGAEPAFKGYHGYPATMCASVNEQVVHGIPSARALVDGDILSIDMGARMEGFFGDCAVTVPVGAGRQKQRPLLRVTEEALFHGIEAVKPVRASRTSARRCSSTWKRTGFRWCASSSAMGLAPRCTRSRRWRTTARRTWSAAVRGDGARDRADGQRREAGGEGARRRVDGGDAGRQPVGALRAHRRGDARGVRNPDAAGTRRAAGEAACWERRFARSLAD